MTAAPALRPADLAAALVAHTLWYRLVARHSLNRLWPGKVKKEERP